MRALEMPNAVPFASLGILLGQALRSVLRHKTRTALNVLGVAIGIAAVVWVVAVGRSGAQRAQEELQKLGDNLVWVEAGSRNSAGVRTGAKTATTLTMDDAEAILREVPLIRRVSPQIDGSAVAVFQNENWTTRFRGVAPDYLPIKRWEVGPGSPFSNSHVERADNVCLLGNTVRERLFGEQNPIGQIIRLAGQPFEVVGVLAAKGQSASGQDQDDTIFVPHTTAQKKLRGNGFRWVDDIVCTAESPEAVAAATRQITSLMRDRHRIMFGQDDDFNIRHPEEVIKAQVEANETFTRLLISIASVALLVGGIGIMNVMLASVAERTREIGVRLAVGASDAAIRAQFLAEAIVLTELGGSAGLILSVAGAFVLERILGWKIAIPAEAFVLALAFSVATGIVFGVYPAWRASRLDPIEALRNE